MTVRAAWKRAWAVYQRCLPDMLLYALLMLVIHLMPLVPALCLLDAGLRFGALACVVLFVTLIPPMRQNAALCMQRALRGERLFDIELVSFRNYGAKLLRGLKRTLAVLLWAMPALAVTVLAYRAINPDQAVQGQNDSFTMLIWVKNTFGGGNLERGVINLLLCYLATWLPLLAGFAFHSGARHAEALNNRQLLKGRRWGQVLTWLSAELTLLPWAAAVCIPLAGYVPELMQAVKRLSLDGVSSPMTPALIIAAACVVLLLPVLPLRDLIIAAYPAGLGEETKVDA